MGWPEEYSFRIPCQTQTRGDDTVLLFDLDNFIGHAINKKEEVVMARKDAEMEEKKRENAKSYFYPPEEDAEPQEIHEMEERFQKLKEQNKKIFGEPVFQRINSARGFETQDEGEVWDMLIEARPLDINHTVDPEEVSSLLSEIRKDPPRLPSEYSDVIEVEGDD